MFVVRVRHRAGTMRLSFPSAEGVTVATLYERIRAELPDGCSARLTADPGGACAVAPHTATCAEAGVAHGALLYATHPDPEAPPRAEMHDSAASDEVRPPDPCARMQLIEDASSDDSDSDYVDDEPVIAKASLQPPKRTSPRTRAERRYSTCTSGDVAMA